MIDATEAGELHFVRDRASGLAAVIAIDDRALGPARGGTRLRPYPNLDAAARDASRLACAMSLKFAVHGLPYGGGKGVIVDTGADAATTRERLRAYGRFIEALGGVFSTGPDYGTHGEAMNAIRETTTRVVPQTLLADGTTATASGVLACLELGLQRRLGGDLAGKRVAVQGVGAVGAALVRQLASRGARVWIADVNAQACEQLASELGSAVQVAAPEAITTLEVDAFAPCAVGDVLGPASIASLRCAVVAGGANNQLCSPEPEQARALADRGVLFVPEFIANAGAAYVFLDCAPASEVPALMKATLGAVLDRAERDGLTPWAAAQAHAEERLAAARDA